MPKTIVKRMIDLRLKHIYNVVMQDNEQLDNMKFQGTERGFLVFFNLNTQVVYRMRRSSIKRTIYQGQQQG